MWYLIKIVILFTIISQIKSTTIRTFTNDRIVLLQNSRFRPLVTEVNGTLIYASFPGYPESKVKLEFEEIGKESCEIPFPPLNDAEYPMNFDSLGNGKLIISFMCLKESVDRISFPNYRFVQTLIVNTTTCQSENVTTIIKKAKDTIENLDYKESIIVAAGKDEFDIFVMSHIECGENKACRFRYNEKSELIGITDFDRSGNDTTWSIRPAAHRDFSNGFFYTHFSKDMTIVKLLDEDLKVLKEKYIMNKSFLFSDNYGSINQCHGISDYDLECDLNDDQLHNRLKLNVEAYPYKKYIRNIKLLNMADGSALVFFILQIYTEPSENSTFSTYIYHLDVRNYSRIVSPLVKFQDNICKDAKNIGISRINDNLYCISFSCRDSVRSKCIVFSSF